MKDFEGANDFYNVIVTVFDLHKGYLKQLFKKHSASIAYKKEGLAQLNPQLYEWLRTINAIPSDESIPQSSNDFNEANSLKSDREDGGFGNRTLLVNALESTAKTEIEAKRLREYKAKIQQLTQEQLKLQELKAQIDELTAQKNPENRQKITQLRGEATETTNRIAIYEGQLQRMESGPVLQKVLDRSREDASVTAEQEVKAAVERELTSYRFRGTGIIRCRGSFTSHSKVLSGPRPALLIPGRGEACTSRNPIPNVPSLPSPESD